MTPVHINILTFTGINSGVALMLDDLKKVFVIMEV